MAYADTARVTANTLRMSDVGSVRTNVRTVTNTFGEAIEGYIDTYGAGVSPAWSAAAVLRQKQQFRDMVVDILRHLDTGMDK
jgi:hypothetical protein